jgi:hypothetical protein
VLVNIYISSADKYTKTFVTLDVFFSEKIKRGKKMPKMCVGIKNFCIFDHKIIEV